MTNKISSMTGFARNKGSFEANESLFSWEWEIKTVNGKSLDVRSKLPNNIDYLSFELKKILEKHIKRGSVSIFINMDKDIEKQQVKINDVLLEELIKKAIDWKNKYVNDIEKISMGDLFNVRGVLELETPELSEEDEKKLEKMLLESFEIAVKSLKESRLAEGNKMSDVLMDNFLRIENLVKQVKASPALSSESLKEKIKAQISQVMESNLSEERLYQEVALYAVKSDINEEIDRLLSHVKTAKELMLEGGVIGRKLDFLCQEFNREANTLCSKSIDIEITKIGMELKRVIDAIREQSLNIE